VRETVVVELPVGVVCLERRRVSREGCSVGSSMVWIVAVLCAEEECTMQVKSGKRASRAKFDPQLFCKRHSTKVERRLRRGPSGISSIEDVRSYIRDILNAEDNACLVRILCTCYNGKRDHITSVCL
jgi:hypothetical protein